MLGAALDAHAALFVHVNARTTPEDVIRTYLIVAALGLYGAACTQETPRQGPPQSSEQAAAQPLEAVANEPESEDRASASGEMAGQGGEMPWQSWDEGFAEAEQSGKSMMLFVYAEWCGRCRELEPVFTEASVIDAARELIMIRHDQDQGGAWLEEVVGDSSTYVPRVIFLNPDGSMQRDLTSTHPRYPLFYTPRMRDDLIANMGSASDPS